MKGQTKKILVMLLSFALAFTMLAMPVYADDSAAVTIDEVRTMIKALPADANKITAEDKEEIENIGSSLGMLSGMTKRAIALRKDDPEPDLRALKELTAIVSSLNPMIMQHFGQGAAELTLRYEDLEIEKESI